MYSSTKTKKMTPAVLYHGSAFLTAELKPGFQHTGVLVRWDETETNKFLYATTERETAIALGFASAVEKKYGLDRFQHDPGQLIVNCPRQPHGYTVTEEQLCQVEVWLYTLYPNSRDHWVLNKNPHNRLKTEYKTEATIRQIHRVDQIDVRSWLRGYEVTL